MKNYEDYYARITRGVNAPALNIANKFLTILFYVSYPVLLLINLKNPDLWKLFLVPAVSFIILSLGRHFINEPRPYETWHIDPLIRKNKKGSSMPSRHIFSSAVIAMSWLYVYPLIGIVFLIAAGISSWIRVVGGVHYPKDVIAGYVIGILSGLFLWLL